jgi:glutathione synthase/RimK-type ligase-like ATP-grasp enzyme
MMRLAVVGNPGNRRVTLFSEAAARAGLPIQVYAWSDVLTVGSVPKSGETVRVDSPGEDAEVDRLLRGAREPARHGEIVGGAKAYAGVGVALDRVAAGGGRLLNPPGDVLTMSDKRRCHAVLSDAGIPVPGALPPVGGYAELRDAMATSGWHRVFVKPAHGSSASGVLALAVAGPRILAVTSVEAGADGRLYNGLRVRRYEDEATIARIVDRLAPDGLHVERWFPKAGIGRGVLDLRVVVIAGEPSHIAVRTSTTPLTNLHLGNARGDVDAVRAAAGPKTWEAAMRTCVEVARCFPRSLHVGVDLMFRVGWREHAVAEVNAFGDLLNGLDTYDREIAALLDGRYDEWAGACVP